MKRIQTRPCLAISNESSDICSSYISSDVPCVKMTPTSLLGDLIGRTMASTSLPSPMSIFCSKNRIFFEKEHLMFTHHYNYYRYVKLHLQLLVKLGE